MPWYVVNGCPVHLKLSGKAKRNPPAQCVARVERDGRPAKCCGISTLLCDWPVDGGTCDAPLCAEHGHQVGADRHYCPRHRAEQLRAAPELF